MAIVIIGGTQYEIPELNFVALERAWPAVELAMAVQDPMQAVGAALDIIAASLMEQEFYTDEKFGVDPSKFEEFLDMDSQRHKAVTRFLKRKLKATEIENVRVGLWAIIEEAGLAPQAGEAKASEENPNPSTETSSPSSPNSSQPDAKAEVGIVSDNDGA
jgi:hypothetical protein